MITTEVHNGRVYLKYRYNPTINADIKTIKGWKFHDRNDAVCPLSWSIPESQAKGLAWLLRRHNGEGNTHAQDQALRAIQRPYRDPATAVPTCAKGPPHWAHQVAYFKAMVNKQAALIDLGFAMGKSRIFIDFCLNTPDIQTVLLLCPASIVLQWEQAFHTWAGRPVCVAPLHSSRGTVAERVELGQQILRDAARVNRIGVVVTNYEAAIREPMKDWLLDTRFDVLGVDECQVLKSAGGILANYAHRLGKGIPYRIGLSGDLFPQGPQDAYGVCRVFDDTIFGTRKRDFEQRYLVVNPYAGNKVTGYINMDDFKEKIDRIRIKIKPSGAQLPEAIFTDVPLSMPDEAWNVYREVEADLYARVAEGHVTVANAAVAVCRLQQITSGFIPLDLDDFTEDPDIRRVKQLHTVKEDALAEYLGALPHGTPVLVFAQFVYDLAAIHRAARQAERSSSELSGKRKTHGEWEAGKTDVLAVQYQSGARGIDTLTRAHHCVIYSDTYRNELYRQALGRVRRPQQKETCYYHHLRMVDQRTVTIDMRIAEAHASNADVCKMIVGEETHRIEV